LKPKALVAGATGNVGSATMKLLAKQGWAVDGLARSRDIRLPDTQLLHTEDWEAVGGYLADQAHGPYDLVLMAQGTQKPARLVELSQSMWADIRASNLDSAVCLTANLIQSRKLNPGALIVYCSSIQASHPRAGRGAYGVAKSGIEALARIASVELANMGVRAVALRLGQLTTPMRGIEFTASQVAELQGRSYAQWPSPDNVAAMTLALYEQPAVTGCTIPVSSGHELNVW